MPSSPHASLPGRASRVIGTVALLAVLLLGGCLPVPPPPPAPATLVLVRHAEREDSSQDSPLSAAGHARAAALRDALEGTPVDLIVVSQYRRTAETAAPLAASRGMSPRVERLEGETPVAAARLAERLAREEGGRTVVIVGHSNTIPAMLQVLAGWDLPELEGYGDLFVVTVASGVPARVERSRFGD
jgi:broad specificity phosphatase PhoE